MTKEELKQRLIDLIKESDRDSDLFYYDLYDLTADHTGGAECFANYLIANGVTIRDRGEWIRKDDHRECSKCGKSATYWQTGTVFAMSYMQAKTDFCPHCGADMRGDSE